MILGCSILTPNKKSLSPCVHLQDVQDEQQFEDMWTTYHLCVDSWIQCHVAVELVDAGEIRLRDALLCHADA